jgi:hypothetical protein
MRTSFGDSRNDTVTSTRRTPKIANPQAGTLLLQSCGASESPRSASPFRTVERSSVRALRLGCSPLKKYSNRSYRSLSMDESMILACKAMDGFGIPAAVVKVQVDRFLFANECFLQVIGLTVADLSSTSLLKIVSFPLKYRLESKPIPVTIRSFNQSLVVRGHFRFGKKV